MKRHKDTPTPRDLAPPLQQVDRTFVLHRGKKLSYFGGCDYFRLSSHPAVAQALREGLAKYGLNVAASRVTTGNHALYELLEERLAKFFGVESATLVSIGYMSNLALAQALAGEFSHALMDSGAHCSLRDAAAFFECPVVEFNHRDTPSLARALRRCGQSARPVLLTDGLFARDGELAPLGEYLRALPSGGLVAVDDAHGAGTLGPTGRGTAEHLGVPTRRIFQTITLSKAFGVYGGAILGPRALQRKIHARSAVFAGQTPLPLPLACAAIASLEILQTDSSLRERLAANTRFVKNALREAGLRVANTPSPIIQVVPRSPRDMARLKERLLGRRIYPTHIRYPGGPAGGYFRFALSSEHGQDQLEGLVAAVAVSSHRRGP